MMYHAKGGRVRIGAADMDYVSFGKGSRILVMLPGLGDGITTVRHMALPMALQYRIYAKRFRVYVFSRKNQLEKGYSTRDMARDQAEAMRLLGIEKANILGISQGGMVARYVAAEIGLSGLMRRGRWLTELRAVSCLSMRSLDMPPMRRQKTSISVCCSFWRDKRNRIYFKSDGKRRGIL